MKIGIGSDHGGYLLKLEIKTYLSEKGYEIVDVGNGSEESVDYPIFADNLCQHIIDGHFQCGILICGTGQGMCMAANRHHEIRAALCQEPFSAKLSREHNNANVLCLGGSILGGALAIDIVHTWLQTEFAGGRHLRRISLFS